MRPLIDIFSRSCCNVVWAPSVRSPPFGLISPLSFSRSFSFVWSLFFIQRFALRPRRIESPFDFLVFVLRPVPRSGLVQSERRIFLVVDPRSLSTWFILKPLAFFRPSHSRPVGRGNKSPYETFRLRLPRSVPFLLRLRGRLILRSIVERIGLKSWMEMWKFVFQFFVRGSWCSSILI